MGVIIHIAQGSLGAIYLVASAALAIFLLTGLLERDRASAPLSNFMLRICATILILFLFLLKQDRGVDLHTVLWLLACFPILGVVSLLVTTKETLSLRLRLVLVVFLLGGVGIVAARTMLPAEQTMPSVG